MKTVRAFVLLLVLPIGGCFQFVDMAIVFGSSGVNLYSEWDIYYTGAPTEIYQEAIVFYNLINVSDHIGVFTSEHVFYTLEVDQLDSNVLGGRAGIRVIMNDNEPPVVVKERVNDNITIPIKDINKVVFRVGDIETKNKWQGILNSVQVDHVTILGQLVYRYATVRVVTIDGRIHIFKISAINDNILRAENYDEIISSAFSGDGSDDIVQHDKPIALPIPSIKRITITPPEYYHYNPNLN